MICPFATYRPVVNKGGAMSAHLGLVLHVQVGTGSLHDYFNNPASQVSAHFWCAKDGTLEQYVDTDLTAWAEVNGNASYLSVETEGQASEELTQAQVIKVAELLVWCAQTYHFPIAGPVPHGQAGFTPHCNPDGTPDPSWGNHSCPGTARLAQMPTVITATRPPPAPPKESDTMTSEILTNPNTGKTEIHVFDTLNGVTHHWWQQAGGFSPPAASWNVEKLPVPA